MAAELAVGLPLVSLVKSVGQLIVSLQNVRAIKKHNPIIAAEIERFIKSLNENIHLLKEQRPNEKSWALESLETDLNAATIYLENNLKDGSFLQFWDAKEIKDKLERLRQDLINKFQVKLFVTTLEVTIDADKKMDDFGSKMVELSSLSTATTRAEIVEIRKLLQPLVVGIKKQDHRIQSLISSIRKNEVSVETSSDTQKFFEDVMSNLQDLAEDEGSSSIPTPEDNHDDYLDPITAELMIDPVKCTDGETYDRLTVFKNNLTQQKQLVIVCDDESVKRRLFKKFPEEDIERRFYSQRKSYRDEAFELANTGHTAEALTMLKNVLMWAPTDKQCIAKRDELQLDLDAKKKMLTFLSKMKERQVESHSKVNEPKVVDMSKQERKQVSPSNVNKPKVVEIAKQEERQGLDGNMHRPKVVEMSKLEEKQEKQTIVRNNLENNRVVNGYVLRFYSLEFCSNTEIMCDVALSVKMKCLLLEVHMFGKGKLTNAR